MIKFEVRKHEDKTYTLLAKGAGIGTGIGWTWIGDFKNMKYLNAMKKVIRGGL